MFAIILLQAYSNTSQKPDDREKVQWVQFQHADINCGLLSTILTFCLGDNCRLSSDPSLPNFSNSFFPVLVFLKISSLFLFGVYFANFATNIKMPQISELHEFSCEYQNDTNVASIFWRKIKNTVLLKNATTF